MISKQLSLYQNLIFAVSVLIFFSLMINLMFITSNIQHQEYFKLFQQTNHILDNQLNLINNTTEVQVLGSDMLTHQDILNLIRLTIKLFYLTHQKNKIQVQKSKIIQKIMDSIVPKILRDRSINFQGMLKMEINLLQYVVL